MRRAGAGALVALLLAGCAPRAVTPAAPGQAHGLRGAQLRATMRELDRLRGARLPQELDLARERARRRDALAETARRLAETAGRIDEAAPLATLAPSDRAAFLRLAAALRASAEAIAHDAADLGDRELAARFAALDETCDACHRVYRDARTAPR